MCDESCMHGFGESLAVVKQPFDSLPFFIFKPGNSFQEFGLKIF